MDLKAHIAKLREEADSIEKALELYPDLRRSTDRWSREEFHSDIAIRDARDVDIYPCCGCCPDAMVFARPYVMVESVKVCVPTKKATDGVFVGNKNGDGEGVYQYAHWREALGAIGASPEIIEKVERFLHEHQVICYEEDDDLRPDLPATPA